MTKKKPPMQVHFRVNKTKVGPDVGKVYAVMLESPDTINNDGPALPVRTLDNTNDDSFIPLRFVRLNTKHADEAQYAPLLEALNRRFQPRKVTAYPKLTRQFIAGN